MIHQMPQPPRVSSLPTAAPTWPRQNLSIPARPRRMEYNNVVRKN